MFRLVFLLMLVFVANTAFAQDKPTWTYFMQTHFVIDSTFQKQALLGIVEEVYYVTTAEFGQLELRFNLNPNNTVDGWVLFEEKWLYFEKSEYVWNRLNGW